MSRVVLDGARQNNSSETYYTKTDLSLSFELELQGDTLVFFRK
jgi:hypothetical protein